MRISSTWRAVAAAALLLAVFAGCPQGDAPEPVQPPGDGQIDQQSPENGPAAVTPKEQPEPEPPPPPTVPEVHMTEALRDTCLVYVDDAMPAGELADLEGNTQQLSELCGEKLTVVLFWTRGEAIFAQMAATAALEDLEKDVAEPYAGKGVAVVAINVNDVAETAAEHVDEAGATFPNLSDPEGTFFAQVATQELPRVYLLDAEGKILWFDLEFSRTSRQYLLQAIQVELGEI